MRAALIRPDGHVARAWAEQDDATLGTAVDETVATTLGRRKGRSTWISN